MDEASIERMAVLVVDICQKTEEQLSLDKLREMVACAARAYGMGGKFLPEETQLAVTTSRFFNPQRPDSSYEWYAEVIVPGCGAHSFYGPLSAKTERGALLSLLSKFVCVHAPAAAAHMQARVQSHERLLAALEQHTAQIER